MADPTYAPTPAYQPPPAPSAPTQSNGLGVAALVLGIISVVLSFIPLIGLAAFPLGGLAVLLGVIGLFLKGRKRGMAITGVILGIVSIVVAAIAMAITAAALTAVGQAAKDADKSTVLMLDDGWKVKKDAGFIKVVGTVSNTSDKAVTNLATITFDVLDANGANTGSCMDSVNTIDAGGKWKFEAICTVDVTSTSKVRFKDITGF